MNNKTWSGLLLAVLLAGNALAAVGEALARAPALARGRLPDPDQDRAGRLQQAPDQRRPGQVRPLLLADARSVPRHGGERVPEGVRGARPLRRPDLRPLLAQAGQPDRPGLLLCRPRQAPRADAVHDPVPGLAPGAVVLQRGPSNTACRAISTSSSTSPRGSATSVSTRRPSRARRSSSSTNIGQLGRAATRSDGLSKPSRASTAELASASLSYLPSDTPAGAASFSSDSIIASVRGLPEKKYSDTYARSYLNYKDYIETEYTDNYIQSSFRVRVFREAGQTFVHWSIEPEKMNFATQGERGLRQLRARPEARGRPGRDRLREDRGDPAADLARPVQGPRAPALRLPGPAGRRPGRLPGPVPAEEQDGQGLLLLRDPDVRAAGGRPPAGARRRRSSTIPGAPSPRPRAGTSRPSPSADGSISPAPATSSPRPRRWAFSSRPGTRPGSSRGAARRRSSSTSSRSTRTKRAATFPLTEVAADPGDPATLLVSGEAPLEDVKPGYYRARVSLAAPDGRRLLTAEDDFVVLGPALPGHPLGLRAAARPVPRARASPGPRLPALPQRRIRTGPGYLREGPQGARRPRRPPAARQVALRPGALQGIPGPRHGPLRARRRPGGGQGHGPRPGRPEGLDVGPGLRSRSSWPKRPRSRS